MTTNQILDICKSNLDTNSMGHFSESFDGCRVRLGKNDSVVAYFWSGSKDDEVVLYTNDDGLQIRSLTKRCLHKVACFFPNANAAVWGR